MNLKKYACKLRQGINVGMNKSETGLSKKNRNKNYDSFNANQNLKECDKKELKTR